MTRRIIISMHDATPFHLSRLEKAEGLFAEMGLSKLTYLLVPQYHGGYLASNDAEFLAWCRKEKPFQVSWHLHGLLHLESDPSVAGQLPGDQGTCARNFGDRFKRKLLTAGEGEFLSLSRESIRSKLETGMEVYRACIGRGPDGFVAPAWLFNENLIPELNAKGVLVTEDQRRIYRCDSGRSLSSPVVTWATRTPLRKYGSLAVCPILARLWSKAPILRIAMHPFDFDHPATVASIRSVLQYALRDREQVFSEHLKFNPAE